MNLAAQFALIACIHIAFLFSAYGTKFFGLILPAGYYIPLWLCVPALLAFTAYFWVLVKAKWLESALYRQGLWIVCAIVAVFVSSYIGMFLAFNRYGT